MKKKTSMSITKKTNLPVVPSEICFRGNLYFLLLNFFAAPGTWRPPCQLKQWSGGGNGVVHNSFIGLISIFIIIFSPVSSDMCTELQSVCESLPTMLTRCHVVLWYFLFKISRTPWVPRCQGAPHPGGVKSLSPRVRRIRCFLQRLW